MNKPNNVCSFNNCNEIVFDVGLCKNHFEKLMNFKVVNWVRKVCKEVDCGKPILSRDYCVKHYREFIIFDNHNYFTREGSNADVLTKLISSGIPMHFLRNKKSLDGFLQRKKIFELVK